MTNTDKHGARLALTALALAATAFVASGPAAAETGPMGVWIDNTGRGAVEISECGKSLCGKVVWVKSDKDRSGCGAQIIGNVKPSGGGIWDSGWIYSPEDGRKYDVELKPVGADKLRVVGYAGIRLFSETYYWKRAPADLARCDNLQTAAAAPDGKTLSDASLDAGEPGKPSATSSAGAEAAAGTVAAGAAVAKAATDPARPSAGGTTKVASAAVAEDDEPAPKRKGGSGLGGLPVGKYLKKSGNTCKLNTPWFKVNFDCKGL
jgi:uncharacterized protein (DUF2147 family)